MDNLIPITPFSLPPAILILAFVLDSAIGDPRWLPHPVRIIGFGISGAEKVLRNFFKSPFAQKFAGILLVLIIVLPVFALTYLLLDAVRSFSSGIVISLSAVFIIYLTSSTIAIKDLIRSAKLVIDAVQTGNLEQARALLSMIVGRDTEKLSEDDVLKATIESISENLSDGVVAPLFYLVIGGLPFALTYKAINTLDSMVGYKNQRHINFGWASAKLDDYVNYIPARITGIFIVLSTAIVFRSLSIARIALQTMLRDGGNHISPNSGVPEAALAGGIGVKLGGPSTYGGVLVKKPYIGESRHKNYTAASKISLTIVWYSSIMSVAASATVLYFLNYKVF